MPMYRVAPCLHIYPPSEEVETEDEESAHKIVMTKWNKKIKKLIADGRLPKLTDMDNGTQIKLA